MQKFHSLNRKFWGRCPAICCNKPSRGILILYPKAGNLSLRGERFRRNLPDRGERWKKVSSREESHQGKFTKGRKQSLQGRIPQFLQRLSSFLSFSLKELCIEVIFNWLCLSVGWLEIQPIFSSQITR